MNNAKQISLVFFSEAIFNVVKLSRVLGMSRGNAMVIGMGGIGRSTLTKLAGFIKAL